MLIDVNALNISMAIVAASRLMSQPRNFSTCSSEEAPFHSKMFIEPQDDFGVDRRRKRVK